MFPIIFNVEYNREESFINFSPATPALATRLNLHSISMIIEDLAHFNFILAMGSENLKDTGYIKQIIDDFIAMNPEDYQYFEWAYYDRPGDTYSTEGNELSIRSVIFSFSTAGLDLSKTQAIEIISDFYRACFAVINVAHASQKSLNKRLKSIFDTNVDFIDLKPQSQLKGLFSNETRAEVPELPRVELKSR